MARGDRSRTSCSTSSRARTRTSPSRRSAGCRRRPPQVAAAATGIAWKQLGPYNIGGRLTDVVADVDRRTPCIRAVAGGGIWKIDATAARTGPTIWPDANVQPMGALAQAQDGTLWAGTGEANPPGGGLTYFGDGIYKSTDNGATWTNMGLRDSEAIGRIAVDPTNSNRVFAAASGHIARSSGDRGLYRTEDAGKTWERVLAPPNADRPARSTSRSTRPTRTSSTRRCGTTGARTARRIYGGVGSGLFRSNGRRRHVGAAREHRRRRVMPTPRHWRPTTRRRRA